MNNFGAQNMVSPLKKVLMKKPQRFMSKVNKKKWNLLKSFRKPKAANFKKKPVPRKEEKQPKNISLSSEKTLQQYKADDPSIFETTVKELYTSKVTVAEQLSDPLKKVIPIALIFGGVMGLMIVMSNAPMVIDKIAEYAGIQPPQVVYLTPFEAIERGLNPDTMAQACVEEYTQSQIPCADYTWFNDKEGGVLPLSDPQHSLFGGDIPQDTFLDDLAGTGDETMVQVDTTPPVLIMPEPIFEDSDTRDGIIVRYNGLIQASDDSGDYELLCEPKSGSIFYIGETVVKCSAVDAAGNATVGEFIITVTGEPEERSIFPEVVTTTP